MKIKNIYFQIIFLICVVLHDIFFTFILFNQFNVCLFLISNQFNVLSCEIKYLDLYLSLDLSNFIFSYH